MQYRLLLSTAITAALLTACSDDKPAEKTVVKAAVRLRLSPVPCRCKKVQNPSP